MPRIGDELRMQRQRHILTCAWSCFARNGFHATSMDEVIAATGMSSSAVYRYYRSKDELIDAAADEGLELTRDLFARLAATDPTPTPAQTLTALMEELRSRSRPPEYDFSHVVIQIWSEGLRRPAVRGRTQAVYQEARRGLSMLAERWVTAGHVPPEADPEAVAEVLLTLMPGLTVTQQLFSETSADQLIRGLTAIGQAFGST